MSEDCCSQLDWATFSGFCSFYETLNRIKDIIGKIKALLDHFSLKFLLWHIPQKKFEVESVGRAIRDPPYHRFLLARRKQFVHMRSIEGRDIILYPNKHAQQTFYLIKSY